MHDIPCGGHEEMRCAVSWLRSAVVHQLDWGMVVRARARQQWSVGGRGENDGCGEGHDNRMDREIQWNAMLHIYIHERWEDRGAGSSAVI